MSVDEEVVQVRLRAPEQMRPVPSPTEQKNQAPPHSGREAKKEMEHESQARLNDGRGSRQRKSRIRVASAEGGKGNQGQLTVLETDEFVLHELQELHGRPGGVQLEPEDGRTIPLHAMRDQGHFLYT
jgi:hypothetical protein